VLSQLSQPKFGRNEHNKDYSLREVYPWAWRIRGDEHLGQTPDFPL